MGDFCCAHQPRQEKGPLISGEGYPGILCPCPLVLHGVVPPPRWRSPGGCAVPPCSNGLVPSLPSPHSDVP